jgi:CMP-N,N'-diacetyllegionaminic acid synthase
LNNGKNIVALIPARGGSKGIKGKNIKLLNGKPLIAFSIEAALKCKVINRIIVSTDNAEIASIAIKYGAEVPFMRPPEISTDQTPDQPVMQHCINWLNVNENFQPEYLAYLRPTTPFKTAILIENCFIKISNSKTATSLRTVTKSEGVFHPYWMYKTEKDELKPFIDGINIKEYYRRQMLPECYRLNGVIDILRPEIFMNQNDIYGKNIIYNELNEKQSVDIDNEFDFAFAEFLMKNK